LWALFKVGIIIGPAEIKLSTGRVEHPAGNDAGRWIREGVVISHGSGDGVQMVCRWGWKWFLLDIKADGVIVVK